MYNRGNSPVGCFRWTPPNEFRPDQRPIVFNEIRLAGRDRLFIARDDRVLDDVVFVGLKHQIAKASPDPSVRRLLAATHMLYRCRYQYYRKPLGGLRECFREENPSAEALLGENARASLSVGSAGNRGAAQRGFRGRLGKQLGGFANQRQTNTAPILPSAVAGLFELPSWDVAYAKEIQELMTRIGDRVEQWSDGRSRGPRPTETVKWLNDRLQHYTEQPVRATSREPILWAVALATWRSWTEFYPAAMREFAKSIDPALNSGEQTLFHWGHLSCDLMGVPLLCVPQRFRDLVEPDLAEFFSGQIDLNRAKARIHSAFVGHLSLKQDALEQDRRRKRAQANAKRRGAAASQLKRRARNDPTYRAGS